jgi:hypothetical protein
VGSCIAFDLPILPQLQQTFPHLKDYILDLGGPNLLVDLERNRALLKFIDDEEGPLDYITAVALEDNPENFYPGYPRSLLEALCEEVCSIRGISLTAWRVADFHLQHIPSPRVDVDIIQFLTTQILKLSYYHARIFRELLSHLPQLA